MGGGAVAARKIELLLSAGAHITVVAPTLQAPQLRADSGEVRPGMEHLARDFQAADVHGKTLVIAATDDRSVNAAAAAAAKAHGIPVNVVDDPELSSFIVPAIVDRDPVQIAISTGGAAPVLARMMRERIESLLDESYGRLAQFADAWRGRLRAVLPQVGERRRFIRWIFEGPAAAQLRAGRADEAEATVAEALERTTASADSTAARQRRGHVLLVGAGPGDPGLLTLRALRALQEADVILHDRLVPAAVLELARRDATLESVGKHVGGGGWTQERINQRMVELAMQGQQVVRLKGGDPFIFGRGGEELEYLRAHGITFEVIPGVTAALACAAHAGIPLTDRRHARVLTLATAHSQGALDEVDWHGLAGTDRTLVIYMGVGTLAAAAQRLMAAGVAPDVQVAMVENGARPEQRVILATVATMAATAQSESLAAPALVVIGSAAALAKELSWFGERPLR